MMIVVKLASDSNLSKPFIPSPPLASAAMVTPTTTTSMGGNGVGGNVGVGGQRQHYSGSSSGNVGAGGQRQPRPAMLALAANANTTAGRRPATRKANWKRTFMV